MPSNWKTDKVREWNRKRQKKTEYVKKLREYRKNKRKNDVQYRMASLLRTNLNKIVNRIKNGACSSKSIILARYVGCDILYLKEHIEGQFKDGMTWGNHGEWHIDHIKPLSSYDLTIEDERMHAMSYLNLRPLWAIENIVKKDKF